MPLITQFFVDRSLLLDTFTLSVNIPLFDLYSADSATSADTQSLTMFSRDSGTLSSVSSMSSLLYSFDSALSLSSQLIYIYQGDQYLELDSFILKSTVFSSSISICMDGFEPFLYINDYFGLCFFGYNYFGNYWSAPGSVKAYNSQLITKFLVETLKPDSTQVKLSSISFPAASTDSATASDVQLETQFSFSQDHADSASMLEVFSFDSFRPFTSIVPFILMSSHDIAFHRSFESKSPFDSDQYTEQDVQLQTIISFDRFFPSSTQTVISSFLSLVLSNLDSSQSFDTQQITIFFGDFGFSLDSFYINTTVAPPSTTTIIDVFTSLMAILLNSGIFGPGSVNFVIDPDSITIWPVGPPPFALFQPGDMKDLGDAKGGGRFCKTWELELIIHLIVQNYVDQSYKDTDVTTSDNEEIGPNQLVQEVIDSMEQALPFNSNGQPTLIELPYFVTVDPIRRYKGSNLYSGTPIRFRVTFRQNLPAQLP
jgi:hypothetical protein